MPISPTHKKPVKTKLPVIKVAKGGRIVGKVLTGSALLTDMQAYHKKVTASPESARDFLMRLGVLTSNGRSKKLIRG